MTSMARAIALWRANEVSSQGLLQAAVDDLSAGADSPALRELAGELSDVASDIAPLVERLEREMGLEHFTEDEAVMWLARVEADRIASGTIKAVDGAALLSQLFFRHKYPKELAIFVELADYWCYEESEKPGLWFFRRRRMRRLEEQIVVEARKLSAAQPGVAADRRPVAASPAIG
jgi:hypothetical protein